MDRPDNGETDYLPTTFRSKVFTRLPRSPLLIAAFEHIYINLRTLTYMESNIDYAGAPQPLLFLIIIALNNSATLSIYLSIY